MFQWLKRWFPMAGPASPAAARPAIAAVPAAADRRAGDKRAGDRRAGDRRATDRRAAAKPAAAPAGLSFEQKDHVDTSYYSWLFGDVHQHADLDINGQEKKVLDALRSIVHSQQAVANLVPRLPGLIPQMLQSLRNDDFSGNDIARMISHDVVLVAAVIRLANISMLNSGRAIINVEHAVLMIGQKGLRQLITAVAFRPILGLGSGHYAGVLAPRIWDQSECCATANSTLAEGLGIDPFEAFLAGLVQNVGLMLSLRIMDQMAAAQLAGGRIAPAAPLLGSDMFCSSLVRNARLLACRIGREWSFPDAVTLAIGEQLNMQKNAAISPLGRLLSTSDYMSKLKILTENTRLSNENPRLFMGLSEAALRCYRQLNAPDVVAFAKASA